MKKLIYLILAVTFVIMADSTEGAIALCKFSKWENDMTGINIGGVMVTSKTSKNDLMMAVAQDSTLSAEESLGYSYQIMMQGRNPYQDRLDQMQKAMDEKIADLSFRKNVYIFLAAVFGILLIISLFKTSEPEQEQPESI